MPCVLQVMGQMLRIMSQSTASVIVLQMNVLMKGTACGSRNKLITLSQLTYFDKDRRKGPGVRSNGTRCCLLGFLHLASKSGQASAYTAIRSGAVISPENKTPCIWCPDLFVSSLIISCKTKAFQTLTQLRITQNGIMRKYNLSIIRFIVMCTLYNDTIPTSKLK